MQVIYSLEIGGSEKLALTILSNLNRDIFQPSVCALDFGGGLIEDFKRNNIPYHILCRKGFEPRLFHRIYKLLKKNRIDIIHTHHFTQIFYSIFPAKLAGVKIVHTEHEYFTYLDDPLKRVLIKPFSMLCEKFTVVGPEVADYFIQEIGVPKNRVFTIPNGIDIQKFDIKSDSIRQELGFQEDEIVFGIVARLEKEKDHRTLMNAFKLAENQIPQIRLLIVGDGSLRKELEDYAKHMKISDKVLFLGTKDIPELLSAIDVFVLSSIEEGLPISLVEAMAARKPVISTNVGSIKHLIQNEINGILVPPKNEMAIGNAMLRLTRNPGLRKEMGEKGHKIAAESFRLSHMIQQYEDIYCSILRGTNVRN